MTQARLTVSTTGCEANRGINNDVLRATSDDLSHVKWSWPERGARRSRR